MAAYFLDSSALVRRYISAEPGARQVQLICGPSRNNTLLLARVASVELSSALNRRLRDRTLNRNQARRFWRLFELHRASRYRVVPLDDDVLAIAERLPSSHRIRAFDAVQVASALDVARFYHDATGGFVFLTADQSQAAVAAAEGLSVEVVA